MLKRDDDSSTRLFGEVLTNQGHVMQYLLPATKPTHSFSLPVTVTACWDKHARLALTPKWMFIRPKTSRFLGVIAFKKWVTSTIQREDAVSVLFLDSNRLTEARKTLLSGF